MAGTDVGKTCYHVGMATKAQPAQYTIRGIPAEVDRALRKTSAERGVSLNQLVVEKLMAATGVGMRRANFSDLVGTWTEDPAFDSAVAAFREVDEEMWR